MQDILASVSSVEGQNGVGVGQNDRESTYKSKQTNPQIPVCSGDKGKDDGHLPMQKDSIAQQLI